MKKRPYTVAAILGVNFLICISLPLVYTCGLSFAQTQNTSVTGLPNGIKVDLPRDLTNADSDSGILKETAVIVSITAEDRIYVGAELTPGETLASKLTRLLQPRKERNEIVYLAVGSEVQYGGLTKIINILRNYDVPWVGLMTWSEPGDNPHRFLVQVPPASSADYSRLKPNPMTLMVSISHDLKIAVNSREHPESWETCHGLVKGYGSTSDASPLGQCLERLFSIRTEQHAYRPGMESRTDLTEDERIEKTVLIKASDSVKYGDFMRVVDAVKGSGASPIRFQISDLEIAPPPAPPPRPRRRQPISGGVLNSKAISLPEPTYPGMKGGRVSGRVTVQVVIDESGKVISAQALSGHPLLRAPAISAARQARFAPTTLSGQPVKVVGVLIYDFARQ